MKTISILITLVFLFSVGTGVLAQETELPDPGLSAEGLPKAGLTPDSPFYFLETIAETIGTFFTFGDIKKAERYTALAAERLAETQAMIEKEKPELIERTLERYEKQLNKSIARAEKAMIKSKNIEKAAEILANAGQTTYKHLDVLAEVYEKVPEQAKPAIEQAMKASLKGHEKAVKALKAKNILGEVPEVVSLPKEVPAEARERIQRKAQEELMVEKALQGSESPRELCVKAGGPPEMCEKIPVGGFESFEALKTFFIEAGAPPEAWELVESKCKEYGATAPDKCFRLLLISSTSAYSSTELKSSPAPSLSEEEIEERRIQRETERALKREAAGESIEELQHRGVKIPEKVQEKIIEQGIILKIQE